MSRQTMRAKFDWVCWKGRRLFSGIFYTRPVGAVVAALCRGRVPSTGLRVRVPPTSPSAGVSLRILLRRFERPEVSFIRSHLRPDLDVIELGSGVGVTSAHILRRIGPGRRFLGVEGNPNVLPMLRLNVDEFSGDHPASIEHAVVVSGGETEGAYLDVQRNHLCSRVGARGGGTKVPAMKLSSLLAKHQIRDFALVSDIEGGEASFILSEPQALAHCRQLVIELHSVKYDGIRYSEAELAKRINELGFKLVDQCGSVYTFNRA